MTFQKLKFETRRDGIGKQARVTFPNGYGASIIIGPYTYGGNEGLYELAVLDDKGNLDYSTPITNDVIGHLKSEDVTVLLTAIENLPARTAEEQR